MLPATGNGKGLRNQAQRCQVQRVRLASGSSVGGSGCGLETLNPACPALVATLYGGCLCYGQTVTTGSAGPGDDCSLGLPHTIFSPFILIYIITFILFSVFSK